MQVLYLFNFVSAFEFYLQRQSPSTNCKPHRQPEQIQKTRSCQLLLSNATINPGIIQVAVRISHVWCIMGDCFLARNRFGLHMSPILNNGNPFLINNMPKGVQQHKRVFIAGLFTNITLSAKGCQKGLKVIYAYTLASRYSLKRTYWLRKVTGELHRESGFNNQICDKNGKYFKFLKNFGLHK